MSALNTKQLLLQNYRELFRKYGGEPEGVQMSSQGQLMRFRQLAKVGELSNKHLLDIGCGVGDFLPFLLANFHDFKYTGIDIVSEMIDYARQHYSHTEAKFDCLDILEQPLLEKFDYVLISSLFNNAFPNATEFLKSIIKKAFDNSEIALAFNFISNRVNTIHETMAYHDPAEVLNFCIDNLSRNTVMHHHYERCDVSVFVYR